MQNFCPYCGGDIFSENAIFCSKCGNQLRELSPEDAALVPPEDQRQTPMPVIMKNVLKPRVFPLFFVCLFRKDL